MATNPDLERQYWTNILGLTAAQAAALSLSDLRNQGLAQNPVNFAGLKLTTDSTGNISKAVYIKDSASASGTSLRANNAGGGGGLQFLNNAFGIQTALLDDNGNFSTNFGIQAGNNATAGAAPKRYGGTGAPPAGLGSNGDLYDRVDGGALTTTYQKRAGAWVGIV